MSTENTEAVDALTARVPWLRDTAADYRLLAADYAKRAGIFSARADEAQQDLDDLLAQVQA